MLFVLIATLVASAAADSPLFIKPNVHVKLGETAEVKFAIRWLFCQFVQGDGCSTPKNPNQKWGFHGNVGFFGVEQPHPLLCWISCAPEAEIEIIGRSLQPQLLLPINFFFNVSEVIRWRWIQLLSGLRWSTLKQESPGTWPPRSREVSFVF